MKDLNRSIELVCPLCAHTLFCNVDDIPGEAVDAPDETRFQCAHCKSIFTKQELLDENQEVIDNTVEEIKEEALEELTKIIRKVFK